MTNQTPVGTGWIEVICGPMFSGKTEELIRRLRRAEIARQRVISFKPATDNRYDPQAIVSHNTQRREGIAVANNIQLLAATPTDIQVVGIDEVQFFDVGIIHAVESLADRGVRVIVAGLDQDSTGKPFEPVPTLLAKAEYITKTLAVCMNCGNPAGRTQRLVKDSARVLVGASKTYEARCRLCHVPEGLHAKEDSRQEAPSVPHP